MQQLALFGGCAGCGAPLMPIKNRGNPKKWCSLACRSRMLYPERAAAGLAYYPRSKVRYATCENCQAFFSGPARGRPARTCGRICALTLRAKEYRERYAADPGADLVRQKARRANRTDEQRARDASRRRAYKQRVGFLDSERAAAARRRALKATVEAEKFLHLDVFERDGWMCGICGGGVDPDLKWPRPTSASLDHIVPLSRGGTHAWTNVRLAHLNCNVRRGNRVEEVSNAG